MVFKIAILKNNIFYVFKSQKIIFTEYRELCGKPGMQSLQKTRILSAETMQVFAKQGVCQGNELANLQRLGEQPFMFNRFGNKNAYLISVFRVYYDIGWFAWERLGYARGLKQKQQLLRRLNAITARLPPDPNPHVLQQQPSTSNGSKSSFLVSLSLTAISALNSEIGDSDVITITNPTENVSIRRTSDDTGVETFQDDYDLDEDTELAQRSISELHGCDDGGEVMDTESCVVLTGGLSNLSLFANASDMTPENEGISRQSSTKKKLHRHNSIGSNGSENSSNCAIM